MFAESSSTDRITVLRYSIQENTDKDGWVRVYDFTQCKYRLVYPGDAMVLCLAGVATVEPPMKFTEREQY